MYTLLWQPLEIIPSLNVQPEAATDLLPAPNGLPFPECQISVESYFMYCFLFGLLVLCFWELSMLLHVVIHVGSHSVHHSLLFHCLDIKTSWWIVGLFPVFLTVINVYTSMYEGICFHIFFGDGISGTCSRHCLTL